MAPEERHSFSGYRVPQPDAFVVVAARGDQPVVGRERDTVQGMAVAFPAVDLGAGIGVPEPRGLVVAGGSDSATVGRDRQVEDSTDMSGVG